MTTNNSMIYKQENDILDGLRNLKDTLMLRRKREQEFSEYDMRNIEERRKMMKQYTEFLPNGQVDEVSLTENDFYRGKLPDNYFIPIEPRLFDRDIYKTTIIDKIIKPIVTEDGKSMIFNFKVENLIEYNGIILSLKIENQNENNWLQLDGKEYNLIKSIKLLFNNVLVETHESWNDVWRTTDLIYSTNYSGTTKDYVETNSIMNGSKQYLQRNTGGLLLSPEHTGTNLVFNPPNDFKSYLQVGKITNGRIDFTQTNVLNIEIPIKLYKFGNFTMNNDLLKPDNLLDLRDFDNITIAVEMNPDAFFVPIFNATIHDLVNVAVDGSWYSENRKLRDQLERLKKLNNELKSPLVSLTKNQIEKIKYKLEDKIKQSKDLYDTSDKKKQLFKVLRDELRSEYVDITQTTKFKDLIDMSIVYNDNLTDPKIILNLLFGSIFDETEHYTVQNIYESLNDNDIKSIVINFINLEPIKDVAKYELSNQDIQSNTFKSENHFVILCYSSPSTDKDPNDEIINKVDAIEVLLKKQSKIFEIEKMIYGTIDYSKMFTSDATITNIDAVLSKLKDFTDKKIHPFYDTLQSKQNKVNLHVKNMKKEIIKLFIYQLLGIDDSNANLKEEQKPTFNLLFNSLVNQVDTNNNILKYFIHFPKQICIYEGSKILLLKVDNNDDLIKEIKKDYELQDTFKLFNLQIDYSSDNIVSENKFVTTLLDKVDADNDIIFYDSLTPQNEYTLIEKKDLNNSGDNYYEFKGIKIEKQQNINNNLYNVKIPKMRIICSKYNKIESTSMIKKFLNVDFIFEILKDYSAENTIKIINDYYKDTFDQNIIKILVNLLNMYKTVVINSTVTSGFNSSDGSIDILKDGFNNFFYCFTNFIPILRQYKLWNSKFLVQNIILDKYIPFNVNEFDDNKVNLPFENVTKTSKSISEYIIDNNFFDETSRRALEIVNLLNKISEMDKNSSSLSRKLTLMDYNKDVLNNINIALDANKIDEIYYKELDIVMDTTVGPMPFLLFGLIDLFIILSKSTILQSNLKSENSMNNIERIYNLIDCVINRSTFNNDNEYKTEVTDLIKKTYNINKSSIAGSSNLSKYLELAVEAIVNVCFEGYNIKGENHKIEDFVSKFKSQFENINKGYYVKDDDKDKGLMTFDFLLFNTRVFNYDDNKDIIKAKTISHELNVKFFGDVGIKDSLNRVFTKKMFHFLTIGSVLKGNINDISTLILIMLRNLDLKGPYTVNETIQLSGDSISSDEKKEIEKIAIERYPISKEEVISNDTSNLLLLFDQSNFLEKIIKLYADNTRINFNIIKKLKNKIDPTTFEILNKLYNSYLYLIKGLITEEDNQTGEAIDRDNEDLRKFWKILYYTNHLIFDFKLIIEVWENKIQDKIISYIKDTLENTMQIDSTTNVDDDIGIKNRSYNKFIESGKHNDAINFTKLKIGFTLKQFTIVKIIAEELLEIRLNGGESVQNEINNFLDPDYIDKLEYKLTNKIKSTLDNPWITQYEYALINSEKRVSSTPKIDKSYIVTDAILVVKSLPLNTKYDARIETFSLNNQPKVFLKKIYSEVFDVNKDFSIPINNNINRLFIYFSDFILEKYPTYRKSTFVSVPLETFALVHGDKIYPETFFVGKISDSNTNIMFLKELAAALGYGQSKESVELMERESPFNRLNYAINSSTTGFVTEKLYLNDILKKYENFDFKEMNEMFLFNNDTNKMVDAVFGYDQEIVSKFILGFDLNKIRKEFSLLGNKEPLTEFRFTFDYNKLQKYKNRIKINIITDFALS